jgi:hypothetical protein
MAISVTRIYLSVWSAVFVQNVSALNIAIGEKDHEDQ